MIEERNADKTNKRQMVFSVLITTYNRPNLALRCAQYAVRQDFDKPYEVIVVNDGSELDYHESEFRDIGVRYIKIENHGMSGARNIGIGLCEGEFVCLCDDDDLLLENHLSIVFTAISSFGDGNVLTHSQGFMQYSDGSRKERLLLSRDEGQSSLDYLLNQGFRWVSGSVFPKQTGVKYPFQNRPFSEAIYHSAELLQELELVSITESTVVINCDEVVPGATRGNSLQIGQNAFKEYKGMLKNELFSEVKRETLYRQLGRWLYALVKEPDLGWWEWLFYSAQFLYFNSNWNMGFGKRMRRNIANGLHVMRCFGQRIMS